MKQISGINTPLKGGMAVLKPFDINALSPDGYIFTRWLAALPWWTPLMMLAIIGVCLLYTSPSPRDATLSRMPSSA